ncbi:MAG: hypothetical protein ACRENL_11455 [Candidatus Dormibacteria bacterium]
MQRRPDVDEILDNHPSAYQAEIFNRTPALVKGYGYVGDGVEPSRDPQEIATQAASLAQALTETVHTSHHNPSTVKGINPVFAKEFALFGVGMEEFGAYASNQAILAELAQTVLGKTITTASPLASGFVPYDLLAPTRLIYPYYTPMRNKIGRAQGQGLARKLKLITGVSGSHTGGSAGNFQDISTSELTNFTVNPGAGATTNFGAQVAVDESIPFKAFIQTEALSWLAQFAGQGFDDAAALINLILMQEFTLNEEGLMLYSTGTALTAPAVPTSLTARAAGSTENAITGFTTNVWVRVTAANEYGETTSSVISAAIAANQVADLRLAPLSPGQQYTRVYVGTGAADPGRAATFFYAIVGGTKLTIQGAIPTSGAVAPAADSGTAASTRYEGFLSVLSGWAATNTVYPAAFQGGYVNQNVGDTLNLNVLKTAFQALWDGVGGGSGFRADPSELVASGRDVANLSQDIITNGHSTAFSLFIQQSELDNIVAGGAVRTIVNPLTSSKLNILVHPYLSQGTAMLMSYTLPHPNANVGQCWENVFVQDLMSVKWPVTDMSFRFSIFALGALVAQAPQYSGLLQGLQLNSSTPYS